MRKRRLAGLFLIAGLLAVVAGFAAATSSGRPAKTLSVAYIPPVIANPTIKAMNDGMQAYLKQYGIKFSTVGGEYNPAAQIVAMNAVLQRKFDGVAVWPLDPKGFSPQLDKAKQAGLKIVVQDSPAASAFDVDVRLDDQAAAKRVAMYAAAQVKKSGKPCAAGIIKGIPVVQILNWRNIGIEQGLKAAGCTILDQQVNQKDIEDGAKPIVDGWKTKYGSKMTLVAAYNDPSALAAVSALGSGGFNPLISGFNGDDIAVEAVKNKTMIATVAQPAVEMGSAMGYAMYLLLVKHQTPPKEVWLFEPLVTQANVGMYVTPQEKLRKGPMKVSFVKQGALWAVKAS
jgi:ribose transport system substrate-binding protein